MPDWMDACLELGMEIALGMLRCSYVNLHKIKLLLLGCNSNSNVY